MLVPGIDRIAATKVKTIWHQLETLAAGTLVAIDENLDPETAALQQSAIVFPQDADNDFARTAKLTTEDGTPIETHMALLSPSGRVLSIVGVGHYPVPFKFIFSNWYLELARHGGKPSSLGTCDEGRFMFGSLEAAEPWYVPGDKSVTRAFFNIMASHGDGSIKGSFCTFREVCFNTMTMFGEEHDRIKDARERIAKAAVTIHHTANAQERISDAVAWIVDGRARAESEKNFLNRLATKVVSTPEVDKFVAKYISTDDVSPRAQAIRGNQREAFRQIMSDTDDLGEHALSAKGITAYGLMQAVTHFEDYVARVVGTEECPVNVRRAFRAFTGERDVEKVTARDYIAELVK